MNTIGSDKQNIKRASAKNDNNLPHQVIRLTNYQEAQELGSPFGTCGIYFNGELKTHELILDQKFEKFVDELIS